MHPARPGYNRAVLPHRRRFLERFARVVLPGPAEGMPDPAALGTVAAIERYVAELHPFVRAGFAALFDGLNVLPLSRGYRKPFVALLDDQARDFLDGLERSRVYALRGAFTAAKALVLLHYYGDPSVESKLGYSDECLAP
jgi:hypothetical protein